MKPFISSLIVSIFLLIPSNSGSKNNELPKCIVKPVVPIIEMPELYPCSCDNAYRCMSDQDYMQMVALIEEIKYLINNACK